MSDMLRDIAQRGNYNGEKIYVRGTEKDGTMQILSKNKDAVWIYLSLPDLIADPGFMALYGEEAVCPYCGNEDLFYHENKRAQAFCSGQKHFPYHGCGYVPAIPSWEYHAIQAFKIVLSGKDAVKYLWDNLPSVK